MARIVIDLDSRGPLQAIIVAEAIQAVLGLSLACPRPTLSS